MDLDGCMRGDRSQKRLIPRKGIEGAQKKFGRPYGYQGNAGGSPARRTTDFGKGGVAAQIRAQGTPEAYGKVGHAMMQE